MFKNNFNFKSIFIHVNKSFQIHIQMLTNSDLQLVKEQMQNVKCHLIIIIIIVLQLFFSHSMYWNPTSSDSHRIGVTLEKHFLSKISSYA